jgi:hypothetical protein
MPMQKLSEHYFKRFPNLLNKYACADAPSIELRLIITIPLFKEEADYVLSSLEMCKLNSSKEVEILAIVNQPADRQDLSMFHQNQVLELKNRKLKNGIPLRVISALDLEPKQAGVGLARKIAMDDALSRFAAIGRDGLIVGLDGDCQVSENYFEALLKGEKSDLNAASLAFEHPLESLSIQEQKNIIDYEIWLRYYSKALEWSNFPFHYLTIGSSMAVRASAYAKIGGMNRRKAGEDFYFLHKLMPMPKYKELDDLKVYPQARISDRVPFGTGRAMAEIEMGKKDFSLVYNEMIFKDLSVLIKSSALGSYELSKLTFWGAFLAEEPKFEHSYNTLVERSSVETFAKNFYHWWDGFKVLKFVHFRSQNYPAQEASIAVNALFGKYLEGQDLLSYLKRC